MLISYYLFKNTLSQPREQGFELVSGKSQNKTCIAIKRKHACKNSEWQKCGFKHCLHLNMCG